VSQVWINGVLQQVEYEYLPTICFLCGQYDHVKEFFPKMVSCSRTGERVTLDGRDSMAADPVMVEDDRIEEDGKEAISEELLEVNNKGIRVMDGARVSGGDQVSSLGRRKSGQ
ncbi:hypothetical protein Golob_002254, partial [Gossypium lobatum]|nr:hypothetical protein [Gossypium lobatum]